jgi:hypothetical protein
VKTGVQQVRKVLKTLDSGFLRNDVTKNQIDFFTPSGEGRVGVMLLVLFLQRLGKEMEISSLWRGQSWGGRQ